VRARTMAWEEGVRSLDIEPRAVIAEWMGRVRKL
jgi:hypothetical protein